MDILLNMGLNFSVLSSYNKNDDGNVSEVYKGHHYAALAPLIDKQFFENYIDPCITTVYYDNKDKFIRSLGKKYQDNKLYKYRNSPGMHNQQAGLINRLVDIALIEEDKYVVMPYINRHQHIGMYGHNRGSKYIPGNNFKQRLANLRKMIEDATAMYEFTPAKMYNDYRIFSSKLNEWDGSLKIA